MEQTIAIITAGEEGISMQTIASFFLPTLMDRSTFYRSTDMSDSKTVYTRDSMYIIIVIYSFIDH